MSVTSLEPDWLRTARQQRDLYAKQLRAIADLHQPTPGKGRNKSGPRCRECGFAWPCATYLATGLEAET